MAEDPILEHVAARLARTPSFRALEAHRLREVAAACAWFCVPGGTVLLRQGEPSDAIYVVVNGLLGAYRRGPQRHDVLLNRIGPGTTVGEIGFITGEPRSATVKALRACELLRIDAADFEHIERLPGVLRRDAAVVDQGLHERVVVSELLELSVAQTICPRVSGMDDRES